MKYKNRKIGMIADTFTDDLSDKEYIRMLEKYVATLVMQDKLFQIAVIILGVIIVVELFI